MTAALGWLGSAASGVLIAPVVGWLTALVLRQTPRLRSMLHGWMLGTASGGTVALIDHDWPFAIGSGASLTVAVAIWWWRRKKRRNAVALLGAKSRALRDALVRKVREAATPRPVLRPVPQGMR